MVCHSFFTSSDETSSRISPFANEDHSQFLGASLGITFRQARTRTPELRDVTLTLPDEVTFGARDMSKVANANACVSSGSSQHHC